MTIKNISKILIILSVILGCAGKRVMRPECEHVMSYGQRGYEYFCKGEFVRAYSSYARALFEANKADCQPLSAKYHLNIASTYFELGILDSSIAYTNMAQKMFANLVDSSSLDKSEILLATIALEKNDIASAKEHFEKLSYAEKNSCIGSVVQGKLSYTSGNSQKALDLYNMSISKAKKTKSFSVLSLAFLYKAQAFKAENNFVGAAIQLDSALLYLDASREQGRRWRILYMYSQIQQCLGNRSSAQDFYNRAVSCMPLGLNKPIFPETCN